MLNYAKTILAAVALVAVVGFYGWQEFLISQKPQKSIHENYGSEQNENKAEPWLVVFRVILPGGLQKITKYCQQYGESEKNKWPQRYYCDLKITDVYIAIFSGLLIFVTGGLAVVGYIQWKDGRVLQRAYLSVLPAGIEPFRSGDGRLSCDVLFVNSGNLPARNVSWFIDRNFSIEDELDLFPIAEGKFLGNNLIPPHGEIRKGGPAVNSAELDAFRHRQQGIPNSCWLYIWGRVRYLDGFNKGRFVDFCYRYYLAGTAWTIDKAHGRQHEYGNRTDEG